MQQRDATAFPATAYLASNTATHKVTERCHTLSTSVVRAATTCNTVQHPAQHTVQHPVQHTVQHNMQHNLQHTVQHTLSTSVVRAAINWCLCTRYPFSLAFVSVLLHVCGRVDCSGMCGVSFCVLQVVLQVVLHVVLHVVLQVVLSRLQWDVRSEFHGRLGSVRAG